MTTSPVNRLILGDNLEILKGMNGETVDLIYLDPPFFSNRNYEVIWGDAGEKRSFEDRWEGGMEHYIGWLKERVEHMHRVLKPTGSIFLHCDWHADAYIRVGILDRIFGINNLVNEISWKRTTNPHNDSRQGAKHFGRITDIIYFYAKDSKVYTFNSQFERYKSDYIAASYSKSDPDGRRFKASELSAAKPGGDTSYEWHGCLPPTGRYWAYSKENLNEFERNGLIWFSPHGRPYLKRYLDEMPGSSINNFWDNCVFRSRDERIGYPTQKPLALLERIIKCASDEGALVLDPFMGGGTTIAAADKLGRRWLGIDQSPQAVKVTEYRLNRQQNPQGQGDLFAAPFTVELHKYDYDTLRYENAFEFESFMVRQFGGVPNAKQRNDLGIDGKMPDGTPIQVKRSDGIGVNVLKNFWASLQQYDKALFEKNKQAGTVAGYIIAFSFGKGAVEEAARLKNAENIIIRLVKVEDIVPVAQKPALSVRVSEASREADGTREIEFAAEGRSEAGIEFYSWDFAYDEERGFTPAVIMDKTGVQRAKFRAGEYTIAVKAVGSEGLENTELVRLKLNGTIERAAD
ncbi:site-specific DNA-methyltransferase [Treponema endosymbiont of Eucomonympha sp.]|uniref:site-specific DNA-methyltransferase n=4 Tax=Treponema endosymbiont of Eucomonympha sp. TaxID=1580831 RepID=UPI000781AF31|nr:site-specific DNA-methyltransferase [Treponema endosymbiont of Eucomonympha sp.]